MCVAGAAINNYVHRSSSLTKQNLLPRWDEVWEVTDVWWVVSYVHQCAVECDRGVEARRQNEHRLIPGVRTDIN